MHNKRDKKESEVQAIAPRPQNDAIVNIHNNNIKMSKIWKKVRSDKSKIEASMQDYRSSFIDEKMLSKLETVYLEQTQAKKNKGYFRDLKTNAHDIFESMVNTATKEHARAKGIGTHMLSMMDEEEEKKFKQQMTKEIIEKKNLPLKTYERYIKMKLEEEIMKIRQPLWAQNNPKKPSKLDLDDIKGNTYESYSMIQKQMKKTRFLQFVKTLDSSDLDPQTQGELQSLQNQLVLSYKNKKDINHQQLDNDQSRILEKIEKSLLDQLKRASIAKKIQLEVSQKQESSEPPKPEPKRPKWATKKVKTQKSSHQHQLHLVTTQSDEENQKYSRQNMQNNMRQISLLSPYAQSSSSSEEQVEKGEVEEMQDELKQLKIYHILDKVKSPTRQKEFKIGHLQSNSKYPVGNQMNNALFHYDKLNRNAIKRHLSEDPCNKDSTVNTCAIKKQKYKNQVIKSVISQRYERAKEIKKIIGDSGTKDGKKEEIDEEKRAMEMHFKKYLVGKSWMDESHDSKDDRNQIRSSLRQIGNQRVFDRIRMLRGENAIGSHEIMERDSLLESIMNSRNNSEWEKYKFSIQQPQVTECSQEQFLVLHADSRDDISTTYDKFSSINDSASILSSQYSLIANSQQSAVYKAQDYRRDCQLQTQKDKKYVSEYYDQYCFFKILNGLKLPMLQGEKGQRYEIKDLIEMSITQMNLIKTRRLKKFSMKFLSEILTIYQKELGAPPMDLLKFFQVEGHLIFRNYRLAASQLNSLAVTLPYMITVKYLNIENIGMHDEQAGYIMQACRGLPKLNTLYIGLNQVGRKFIEAISHQSLRIRLQEVSFARMYKSTPFMVLICDKLQHYNNLKQLDLSGNPLSNEAAKSLQQLLERALCLEFLNLSSSLQSFAASRHIFTGLNACKSLKYLNLSCNRFNNNEKEFGARIGRLIQLSQQLIHFDIRNCKLTKEEILFIVVCLRDNPSIMAIHLGCNSIDYDTRVISRKILNAKVKHAMRSEIQIAQNLKTAEDKNLVLILNCYMMSSMPPDNVEMKLTGGISKPIRNLEDLKQRIDKYLDRAKDKKVVKNEFNCIMPKFQKSLLQKLNEIRTQKILLLKESENLLSNIGAQIKNQVYRHETQFYFQNQSKRIYDMVQFLDFYGRKFRYLNYDNDSQDYAEVLQQMQLKYGETDFKNVKNLRNEPSLIIMQNQHKSEQLLQSHQDQTVEDIVACNRESQQLKDLEFLVTSKGTIDENEMNEIKAIYKWMNFFNQVDTYMSDFQAKSGQEDQSIKDLVFERIIDHPVVKDQEQWRETSDCWICGRHNHVRITMSSTRQVSDPEFEELMQLTSLLNDREVLGDEVDQLDFEQYKPIYEDVLELVSDTDDSEQGCKRKVTKLDTFSDDFLTSQREGSAEAQSRIKSPSNFRPNTFDEFIKKGEQSAPLSKHSKCTTYSPQEMINPLEDRQDHYKFNKFSRGRNLVTLTSKLNENVINSALKYDLILNHSQVSSVPIRIKGLQEKLQPISKEENSKQEAKAAKNEGHQQIKVKKGIKFKDMQVRYDLLQYEESEEDDIEELCGLDDNSTPLFKKYDPVRKEFISARSPRKLKDKAEFDDPQSPYQTTLPNQSIDRYSVHQRGRPQTQHAMKTQEGKQKNIISSNGSGQVLSFDVLQSFDKTETPELQEQEIGKNGQGQEQKGGLRSKSQVQFATKGNKKKSVLKANITNYTSTGAFDQDEASLKMQMKESEGGESKPAATQKPKVKKKKTDESLSPKSEPKGTKSHGRKKSIPKKYSGLAIYSPPEPARKEDFKTLQQIKADMRKEQVEFMKNEKRMMYLDEEQELKEAYEAAHKKKWQYPKKEVVSTRYNDNEKKSAVETLTSKIRKHWYKLKQGGEENSMYMIASFNHWFPIKMNKRQLTLEELALQSKTTKKSYIESKPDQLYHYESSGDDDMLSQDSRDSLPDVNEPPKLQKQLNSAQPYGRGDVKLTSEMRLQQRLSQLRKSISSMNTDAFQDLRSKEKEQPSPQKKKEEEHLTEYIDLVPPGKHYFYFVRDGQYFCLSKDYPVELFPGTNLKMNTVEVDLRQWEPHEVVNRQGAPRIIQALDEY